MIMHNQALSVSISEIAEGMGIAVFAGVGGALSISHGYSFVFNLSAFAYLLSALFFYTLNCGLNPQEYSND